MPKRQPLRRSGKPMPKQTILSPLGETNSEGDAENVKRKEISAEIEEIRAMNKNQLHARWIELFKKEVPKALTKDLLARMIVYRI